jgi:hypothetical protein
MTERTWSGARPSIGASCKTVGDPPEMKRLAALAHDWPAYMDKGVWNLLAQFK